MPGPIGRLSRVGASTKGGVMAVATSVPQRTIVGSGIARPQRQTCQTAGPRPAPAIRIWSTRRALALSRPDGSSRMASRRGKNARQAPTKSTSSGNTKGSNARPIRSIHSPAPSNADWLRSIARTAWRSVPGPALPRRQPAEAPARPGKRRRCAILEPWHQPDRATAARPAGRAEPPRPSPAARNEPAAGVRGQSSTAAADRQSPAWPVDEHCPEMPSALARSAVVPPLAPRQAATSSRGSRTTRLRAATPRSASVDRANLGRRRARCPHRKANDPATIPGCARPE